MQCSLTYGLVYHSLSLTKIRQRLDKYISSLYTCLLNIVNLFVVLQSQTGLDYIRLIASFRHLL